MRFNLGFTAQQSLKRFTAEIEQYEKFNSVLNVRRKFSTQLPGRSPAAILTVQERFSIRSSHSLGCDWCFFPPVKSTATHILELSSLLCSVSSRTWSCSIFFKSHHWKTVFIQSYCEENVHCGRYGRLGPSSDQKGKDLYKNNSKFYVCCKLSRNQTTRLYSHHFQQLLAGDMLKDESKGRKQGNQD